MDILVVRCSLEDIGLGLHQAFLEQDILGVIASIAGQGNFVMVDSSVEEDKFVGEDMFVEVDNSVGVDSPLAFIILDTLASVNLDNLELASQVQGNLALEDILVAVR